MYISKKDREIIKQKYGGKCAYTGTELQKDWQVDHAQPVRRNWWKYNSALHRNNHQIQNMIPAQRVVNHYKHSMDIEQFRDYMHGFHERISKLPKNPRIAKSIKRKAYMLEIAMLFDITPEKPFSGFFFFETLP